MTDSDRDDTTRGDLPGGHPDESALDRWRTGELAAEERAQMAAHLDSCEACRRALAELEAFAAVVGRAYAADRELAAAEEPDWARVQARVAEGVAASGREARARRSAWARWAPQAAAAVVALVVVGVLWREGVRGPEDARQIAQPSTSAVGERVAADADEPSVLEEERDGADDLRDAAEAPGNEAQFRREAAAEEALADRVAPSRDMAAPQEDARAAAPAPADQNAQNLEREERANEALKAAPEVARLGVEGVDVVPHHRFADQARAALAARDTVSARRTLALWRDTLAPRDELDSTFRRQAEALADSLAAFLAAFPN